MSSPPRRPVFEPTVVIAPTVTITLDGRSALAALAAVHEARRALRAREDPTLDPLLDALAVHERELGLALGADRARAFLRRRAARRASTP